MYMYMYINLVLCLWCIYIYMYVYISLVLCLDCRIIMCICVVHVNLVLCLDCTIYMWYTVTCALFWLSRVFWEWASGGGGGGRGGRRQERKEEDRHRSQTDREPEIHHLQCLGQYQVRLRIQYLDNYRIWICVYSLAWLIRRSTENLHRVYNYAVLGCVFG